ncbi:MAG: hypothetical protein DA328_03810 [Nitrososphaeraceae archaeon]|nr:hypothetical protein [Nitrososphaeraceae archaeon]
MKVRKNSKCTKTNHYLRNSTVQKQKTNLQLWKRWIVESVFSCIKRMLVEYVAAIRFENTVEEMILKAALYNLFSRITVR